MRALAGSLPTIVLTFWVGALWTMGTLVAPTLFRVLPDRMLAGAAAGRMFSLMGYVGLACGTLLLVHAIARSGREAFRRPFAWLVLTMILLTAIGEFGIQPVLAGLKQQTTPLDVMQSPLRDRFATWHGVASSVYLLNCVLGLALVIVHYRAASRGD